MGVHKEMWLKGVVRIWGLHTILIDEGEGEKGIYVKTNNFLEGGWGREGIYGKTNDF